MLSSGRITANTEVTPPVLPKSNQHPQILTTHSPTNPVSVHPNPPPPPNLLQPNAPLTRQ